MPVPEVVKTHKMILIQQNLKNSCRASALLSTHLWRMARTSRICEDSQKTVAEETLILRE